MFPGRTGFLTACPGVSSATGTTNISNIKVHLAWSVLCLSWPNTKLSKTIVSEGGHKQNDQQNDPSSPLSLSRSNNSSWNKPSQKQAETAPQHP